MAQDPRSSVVEKQSGANMQTSEETRMEGKGKWGMLTSRHNPSTTLADSKLVRLAAISSSQIDHDFALVHKEAHLHLARVLRALETLRWQLDDAAAEEGEGHDFGVLEFRVGDVAGDDC